MQIINTRKTSAFFVMAHSPQESETPRSPEFWACRPLITSSPSFRCYLFSCSGSPCASLSVRIRALYLAVPCVLVPSSCTLRYRIEARQRQAALNNNAVPSFHCMLRPPGLARSLCPHRGPSHPWNDFEEETHPRGALLDQLAASCSWSSPSCTRPPWVRSHSSEAVGC